MPRVEKHSAQATQDWLLRDEGQIDVRTEAAQMAWAAALIKCPHRLLSVKEVAKMLRLSDQKLYEELEMPGMMEHFRFRRTIRISAASVMMRAWECWSGRHHATHLQVMMFVTKLVLMLPTGFLEFLRTLIEEQIAKGLKSEKRLGVPIRADSEEEVRALLLQAGKSLRRSTAAHQPEPEPEPSLF